MLCVFRGIDHELDRGTRSGDEEAARRIWQRFSPRVASLARQKLPVWLRRVVDGDDLANSAMCSIMMGLRAGRFQSFVTATTLGAPGICHSPKGA